MTNENYMYLNTLPYGADFDPEERIVCAANRYGDVILAGVRHGCTTMYSLWDNVEEHDSCFFDNWHKEAEQGFLTSRYRFVNRYEAWKIALKQKQIVRLVGSQSPTNAYEETELFSENLY
jgi:hypothetical protein